MPIRRTWGTLLGLLCACDSGAGERPCPANQSCHPWVSALASQPDIVTPGGSATLSFRTEAFDLVEPSAADDEVSFWEGTFRVYLDLDYLEESAPDVEQTHDSEHLMEGWEVPALVPIPAWVAEGSHTLTVVLFLHDGLPARGAQYSGPAVIEVRATEVE